MPTENRRVATYLPKHIDDRLEVFKSERGLKGDSPALIVILEEFFGVSQKVAHLSSSESTILTQRIEAVEQKISQIKDELLSELQRELLTSRTQSIEQAKDELLSELHGELPKTEALPGQLELLVESDEQIDEQINEQIKGQDDELLSESKSELSQEISSTLRQPLNGKALSLRFGLSAGAAKEARRRCGDSIECFTKWSIERDPDDIAWRYNETTKKFHPDGDSLSEPSSRLKSELLSTTQPEF